MMEELFWEVLKHFQNSTAHFGNRYKGLPRRFKKAVSAIDSSTIALIANCMSWAKHRRRKAAAKLHLRLDLQTFLPACAIVEEASHHDDTRAQQLCANLQEGETALFDKAYINFLHLFALNRRGVHWVTRAKDNMAYTVKKRLLKKPAGKILRDDLILLKSPKSRDQYPDTFRRVEMLVELGRQGNRHGLHYEQHRVGRQQRGRALQKPLGHRSVLQADQTNPAHLRLPRKQQTRHSLAALGGAAAIPVAASPWSAIQLASQLQPTVHHPARTAMG
jgi:hypothetical protein